MHAIDPIALETFLAQRKDELRRIVFHSQGQWSFGDIPGEAWMLALQLQQVLGRPLDLDNQEDAGLLLRKLRREANRAGGILRNARRPDQASPDDETNFERGWDHYASDDGAHPLSLLEALETPPAPEPAPVDPYHSESAAWSWLWHRFDRSTRGVAAFLLISTSWCRQRRKRALRHLDAQQQLPHRMRIDEDEAAIQPWRRFKLPARAKPDEGQLALDFCCRPAQPERGQLWLL